MSPAMTCHQTVYDKRARGARQGQQELPSPVSPGTQDINIAAITTFKSKLAVMPGKVGGAPVEVMLDCGLSVSIVLTQAHG